MDERVVAYIDLIVPGHRALFDRVNGLILEAFPEVTVGISYRMLTYRVGGRRLYVGAWKHGLSLYGWPQERVGGFTERHPGLRTSKGTIQIRPEDAAGISDQEFLALIHAGLAP
jgi:uncharacterized protein YdhG (YjbR/CyaY superfamily)